MNHRLFITVLFICHTAPVCLAQQDFKRSVLQTLKPYILAEATWAMKERPVTVTAYEAERSAGGKHDFYSEGDYWWPDPQQPEGPYIQRDGQTNPGNFVAHRKVMIRLSRIIGALASAYRITGDEAYVQQAFKHLKAWFVDPETMMNPSLLYAQAIKGRVTGRGIGIIDTIHLMEVAQGVRVMESAKGVDKQLVAQIKNWFSNYVAWLTTHPYGKDEMHAENNHGTCWVMQVASFAKLTGQQDIIRFCKERYRSELLPNQMTVDGSFPREVRRTKPYGYSLFNLDAMVMVCHILSDAKDDLWTYETSDGKSLKKGISFLYPYVKAKDQWPFAKDVMYWDEWPVAHPFLVFGALRFGQQEWLNTWQSLNHAPQVEEVIRNLPVRNPVIWMN